VLDFVDWAEFERRVGPAHAETTRQHTVRSITASITRAREVLGYAPRYSSLDALREALTWLVAHGQADVGRRQLPAVRSPGEHFTGVCGLDTPGIGWDGAGRQLGTAGPEAKG
jgi:hypothetical protein